MNKSKIPDSFGRCGSPARRPTNGGDAIRQTAKTVCRKKRRPKKTPLPKAIESYEKLILGFRFDRNPGAGRIQVELIRHHNFKLSTKIIEKILRLHNASPIRRHKNLN